MFIYVYSQSACIILFLCICLIAIRSCFVYDKTAEKDNPFPLPYLLYEKKYKIIEYNTQ